ncbi:MAG TPA: serine/threonine-protein kinase [Trebonia sp.]
MKPLSPSDPRTVGEFQLRARLGSGGMGQVYLGYSPAGRAVAVKVVRPELAGDPEFSRRFAREVDAAKAVGGMYTAPVVAAGLDDDPPWLATAFVPGPSLAELVDRHGPLPGPTVWRLAAGLTEALQAVHACGLVHRDLKPANVLLALDGPHLIDFGISRALDGSSLTQTGIVVGTPGYMAPEQAEGEKTGPASDVFSLGALLAFAATGKAPFGHGSAAAVLYRLVSGEPDLDGLAPDLREVITACMTKDQGKRPALPELSSMIVKHGPGLSWSPSGSFWPSEVAGFIRASQPDLEQAQDRTLAAAGAAPGGTLPVSGAAAASEAASPVKPARDGNTRLAGNAAPSGNGGVPAGAVPRPGYGQGAPGYRPGTPGYGPPPGYGAPGYRAPGYRAPNYGAPGQNVPNRPYNPHNPYRRYTPPRQYTPPRLVPMTEASRLMRLGAALTLVNAIVTLASIAQLKASILAQYPNLSANTARAIANGAAGATVVGGAVSIALWLWLAGAAKRGRPWARPTGTTLFGLYTLGVLSALKNPGIAPTKGLGIAIWVVGLLAVIAMWARRPR